MSRRAEPSLSKHERRRLEAQPWRGPQRHYDIIKEATIAVVVMALLAILLSVLFSSPDKRPVTLRQWADAQPAGFVQVALSELAGTSTTATYGPPFNNASGSVQHLGPVSIQRFFGVSWPIDAPRAFVIDPLKTLPSRHALASAIRSWQVSTRSERTDWTKAYGKVVDGLGLSASVPSHSSPSAGPVPVLLQSLLRMAQSGGLDNALVSHGTFYSSDYSRPLMFLGDSATSQPGSYWNRIVAAEHLLSSQWGVMNETGSWPGQPWLWLYSMWYQVPPMSTSPNVDILVIAIMTALSLGLLLLPFIPGLRSIPRWIPVHRVIWRNYYRRSGSTPEGTAGEPRA